MKDRLLKKLKKLSEKIFAINGAFHVWKTLEESYNINEVGEEKANHNVSIINDYKGFFQPSLNSVKHFFLIELAKLFDDGEKNKSCISLPNVINFAVNHKDSINSASPHRVVPINHHHVDLNTGQSKEWVEEKEVSSFIEESILLEIKGDIESINLEISKIKIFRDKWLAHNEESPTLPQITLSECHNIIIKIVDIFNKLNLMIDRAHTSYDFSNEQSVDDTKLILEDLYKFKIQDDKKSL